MLDRAYDIGRRAAIEDFEKEAFLGAAFNAGKFLLGFGGRASQWIGMPLGSGLIGAYTAEPGEGGRGFITGAIGGLAGAGAGALAGGLARRAATSAGNRLANTDFGKKVWQSAGNLNKDFGVNSLAKHQAKIQKEMAEFTANPKNAGKVFKPPPPPSVLSGDSFGQHVIRKLPGAAALTGTIGGFIYGTQAGESLADSMMPRNRNYFIPNLGTFGQRSAFNPVR